MERMDIFVTEQQMGIITAGWSATHDIIGQPVFNEQDDRIGVIDDIIITPDNYVSYVVIGVGGFLGVGKNDVAIPIQQLELHEAGFLLPGATKDQLKTLPKYDYSNETH